LCQNLNFTQTEIYIYWLHQWCWCGLCHLKSFLPVKTGYVIVIIKATMSFKNMSLSLRFWKDKYLKKHWENTMQGISCLPSFFFCLEKAILEEALDRQISVWDFWIDIYLNNLLNSIFIDGIRLPIWAFNNALQIGPVKHGYKHSNFFRDRSNLRSNLIFS
jgi:hypothetical protein